MSPELWRAALEGVGPHVVVVALCGARLLPVAFLCPLWGGQATPTTVRLSVVLSLALFLHWEAGVSLSSPVETPALLAVYAVKELSYGTAVGLVAALPFDAARMGGRFIDLFRGTSAEASLPVTGSRESASGELLHQLLVCGVLSGGWMPLVLSGLARGFGWVPLGASVPSEEMGMQVAGLVGSAMATGFAVGAPVAAATMTVDCLLGTVSRAAPQMNLQDVGAPVRILAGGALLWWGVGLLCERLLTDFSSVEDTLSRLAQVAR
jgi:flagellar biosynthesis protein FliR